MMDYRTQYDAHIWTYIDYLDNEFLDNEEFIQEAEPPIINTPTPYKYTISIYTRNHILLIRKSFTTCNEADDFTLRYFTPNFTIQCDTFDIQTSCKQPLFSHTYRY